MVPQTLAALDEAEIADDAVIAATHASEPCSPELIAHTRQHPRSMHCLLIPSNHDADRIIETDKKRRIAWRDPVGVTLIQKNST